MTIAKLVYIQNMLNQTMSSSLLIIITALLSCTNAYTDRMQVIITNTPQFYYSHNCELTLSVISSSFLQYNVQNSESFLIKIMESYENVRFMPYFKSPLIYTNTSILIKQSTLDNCNRGSFTNNFTCVFITSNRLVYPDVKLHYNATHSMYKFVLNNVVCPIRDVGPNKYHLKIQVQVPVSAGSSVIRMGGNFTHRFVGLKYRIVQNVLANPLFTTKGQPIFQNQTQVQAKNYLIAFPSKLSLTLEIANQTQLNSWQTLKISFTQPPKSLTINTSSCKLTTSQQLITGNLSNFYNITQSKNIPCSYSATTNILTFTNPNYVMSSFMYNQAFNVYGLYVLPACRLNFSVDVVFTEVGSASFSYKMVSQTDKMIDDYGNLTNISTQTGIVYESNQQIQTIFGVNLTQYEAINEKYRVYCRYKDKSNTSSNITNNTSTITIIASDPNLNSFIVVICILVAALLVGCVRKVPYKWEKYLFLIFVISDLMVKIVLIGVVDSLSGDAATAGNREVSFILSIFLAIQYLGLGTVLFFTYCTYIFANRRYLTKNSHSEQKHSRMSIFFMIFALLFNYKFYCICLFNIRLTRGLKTKRFKNKQLYIKYCWHLCVQILLILIQVFCVFNSCTNLAISLVFVIHQGVYVMLIALVGKSVYWMLGVRGGKDKIKDICKKGQTNTEPGRQKARMEQQDNKLEQELQIQSKKSMKQMRSQAQPTQRPFIPHPNQS